MNRSRLRERVAWSVSALLALVAAAVFLFQDRPVSSPPVAPKRFVVTLPDLRFDVSDGPLFAFVPDGSGIVYLTAAGKDQSQIHLYGTMASSARSPEPNSRCNGRSHRTASGSHSINRID